MQLFAAESPSNLLKIVEISRCIAPLFCSFAASGPVPGVQHLLGDTQGHLRGERCKKTHSKLKCIMCIYLYVSTYVYMYNTIIHNLYIYIYMYIYIYLQCIYSNMMLCYWTFLWFHVVPICSMLLHVAKVWPKKSLDPGKSPWCVDSQGTAEGLEDLRSENSRGPPGE